MPASIQLPPFVIEGNLIEFIRLLGAGNGHTHVIIDFSRLKFMIAGGMVALTTKVASWDKEDVEVEFINYTDSAAFRYLQRMNLFRACGWDLPENFRRHHPRNRFVPVRAITGALNPDTLATDVASVIVPESADEWDPDCTGAFDYVEYAISELASNVLAHSRGTGFVCAQYYPSRDTVRVSIADSGIGIRESFRNSPHWREGMTDQQAVRLALQPEVSSKTHIRTIYGESPNAGVGLTLLERLARRTDAEFLVVSGEGYYSLRGEGNFRDRFGFNGTLCAMTFRRDRVRNFANLLFDAKVEAGLIQPRRGDHSEMFR